MNAQGDALTTLDAPPVFVVGMHRSGTTWVYDILAAHREVAGVFESGLFSPNLGLGGLFHQSHWHGEGEDREEYEEFFGSAYRLRQLLPKEEMVDDIRAISSRWLAKALEPHHRYLVEKSPEHVYMLEAINELFPDAAVVHIVRDGRASLASGRSAAAAWPSNQMGSFEVAHYSRSWCDTVLGTRQRAEELGIRYFELRYEDLRTEPREWARRVLDFCRIDTDEEQLDAIVASTDLETHTTGNDRFRRTGKVRGWERDLGIWEGRVFHRVAGALLLELGYETDRLWWGRRAPSVIANRLTGRTA